MKIMWRGSIIGVVLLSCWLAQPAQAAVDWSACRTQSGEVTMATSDTSTTTTLVHPVTDTQQAFVLVQAAGTNAVQSGSNHLVMARLMTGTQVRFDRWRSGGEVSISYTVVECFNHEFSVQRGRIDLTSGATTGALAITAVDPTRSVVMVSSMSNEIAASESTGLMTGTLNALGDAVNVQRAAATVSAAVQFQVITFAAATSVSVQTAEVTFNNPALTEMSFTLSSAVDTQRAWVYCSWTTPNSTVLDASVGCELDDTTVTVHHYAVGAAAHTVRYYVVQFPADTVTVQHGSTTANPAYSDNLRYDYDVTLPDNTGAVRRNFAVVTSTSNDNGLNHPRGHWLTTLTSGTTLQFSNWRSDPASNSDAHTHYWQVVSFPGPYRVSGWGWIGNAVDTSTGATPGLISFNCESVNGSTCAFDYAVELEHSGCTTACDVTGMAWVGTYDLTAESASYPLGMLDFDPVVSSGLPRTLGDDSGTSEDDSLDAHWNQETGELYGWARWYSLQQYETSTYGASAQNDWGWVKLRGPIQGTSQTYGVMFDPTTNAFSGWAWNDNGSNTTSSEIEGSGLGWIKFDLDLTTSYGIDWLQTSQGDVYARDGIDLNEAAPTGEYNATYLIQSNGVLNNFSSQYAASDTIYAADSDYGDQTIPTDNGQGVYHNSLSTIAVDQLIAQAHPTEVDNSGDCDQSLLGGKTNPLGDRVFYCANSMDINTNVVFYNGIANTIGSGTIIVGGDLRIHDNLSYYNTTLGSQIVNLASVAFIVLGKVEIDPTVTEMVGTYIVLGDAGDDPDFSTGDGTLALTVQGTVAARSFYFGRSNVGSSSTPQAAERFLYDGRVIANPPPGLEDLVKVLPRFSEGS